MKTMHIVIVGGGFAGIRAARNLASDERFKVTLISERPAWEYHAALYRTSTGHSPLAVRVPMSQIFEDKPRVKFVCQRAKKIFTSVKEVEVEDGTRFEYDRLILALGSVTAYFGIKGLDKFSYGIKTVSEALKLRSHLHTELTGDSKMDLNYVIVGAGPTGVELAAEMHSYLGRLRKRYFIDKKFNIMLVEAAPRILPALPEAFAHKIEKRLKHLGIKIYTSTAVKAETADELELPEGNIKTHTVVWTAGVTNNPFFASHPDLFNLGKGGKVMVDAQLKAAEDIFVLGDSASTVRTGWAQTAIYDANFVTDNLLREFDGKDPAGYTPPKPIAAIPVGLSWCAVSNENGKQFFGYPGWLIRRYIDLKLYTSLLPFGLALSTWMRGSHEEEE